ncbi:phenylalanine--tRNA ligase subunit beta [Candidatus Babeliales bacterium]|nr:phenylalanine--tRNA ligase subunit beta [Candidatus Babeliales bacterium]
MKILLSWLADHCNINISNINVAELVNLFNIRTAEIESFSKITFNKDSFFIAQIKSIDDTIQVQCPELNQTIILSKRTDAIIAKWYMIKKTEKGFNWTSPSDFTSTKEGLMPALHVTEQEALGSWKDSIPPADCVLEIDNKSINHRPDLWGHYGIAREIAAFLNVALKPLEQKLSTVTIDHGSDHVTTQNLTITLQNPEHCLRIAGLFCQSIKMLDSIPSMAIRLAQIDIKPINAVVDLTNVVMADIGHPMHAFDAANFNNHTMIARMANNQEPLELLDGSKATLEPTDIVIANQNQALSLAGIMGGKNSGINSNTQQLILEAAGFNPTTIRKTAQRLKLRTESCMRFEKYLDPMQNITAIRRFMFLANHFNIVADHNEPIVSVGAIIQPVTCTIKHEYIQNQIGTTLDPHFVQTALIKLGFQVRLDLVHKEYEVTVPTTRLTKDIKIQQDLVEEVVRAYGFENLKTELPERYTQPFSIRTITNIDHIKQHLAFGLHMHEVREYLLYDADFIKKLPLDLTQAITVKNPLSQNWTTLTTSLIPHLLKAIESNAVAHDHLRFFEINNIWHKKHDKFIEEKKLSGIIFDKKSIDFYSIKNELNTLFDMLNIAVTWQKPTAPIAAWYHPYQVAQLMYQNECIGFAGMLSIHWMRTITPGSAFIFELDASMLEKITIPTIKFKQWSKFQDVCHDISLFIPAHISIAQLEQTIKQSNKNIINVAIIDFIEKTVHSDMKAITLRYTMNDENKTMTKEDIQTIEQDVKKAVQAHGAQIR